MMALNVLIQNFIEWIIFFFRYSLNTYTSSVDRISKVFFRPLMDSDGLHMTATLHKNVYKLWSPYDLLKNDKRKIKLKILKINLIIINIVNSKKLIYAIFILKENIPVSCL